MVVGCFGPTTRTYIESVRTPPREGFYKATIYYYSCMCSPRLCRHLEGSPRTYVRGLT